MFESLKNFLKTNIEQLDGKEVQISNELKEHRNKDSKFIIQNLKVLYLHLIHD